MLFSQPEEVEPEPELFFTPKDVNTPPSRTLTPVSSTVSSSSVPATPVPTPRKVEQEEPEVQKEVEREKTREDEKEKVKEGSRLARKFKQFRKGWFYKLCKNITILY